MSSTIIRFPRARSLTSQSVNTVLTNNNITLPYGSPLTFTSTKYKGADSVGSNHLFCVGDGLQQPHTPVLYHVGPYWADVGLSIDNNSNSNDLGKISLNLQAGTAITITDNTNEGSKTISAVTSSFNKNISGTISNLYTLSANANQTLNIAASTEREYYIVDCTSLSLSQAGVTVTLNVAFANENITEVYVLFKNIPGEAHSLTVNINYVTSNNTSIANIVKPNLITYKNGYLELCCKQIKPTDNVSDIHAVFTYITHQTS